VQVCIPPHSLQVTLLFPLTMANDLSLAVATLQTALAGLYLAPFALALNNVESFATRDYKTVYLGLSKACTRYPSSSGASLSLPLAWTRKM
jgi:hypothetical protein